uniref:Uncharacterized protein n=1 Tax=Sphaerodactylus townsendi TaxID=933632 RepID=A0ACB8FDJ8_9SAUR
MDYQNKGKTSECSQYQQLLHTNLVYLATIADSNQNMQSILPPTHHLLSVLALIWPSVNMIISPLPVTAYVSCACSSVGSESAKTEHC